MIFRSVRIKLVFCLIVITLGSSFSYAYATPFRNCGLGYVYLKFDDLPSSGTITIGGYGTVTNGQTLLIGCGADLILTANVPSRYLFLQWTSSGGGFFIDSPYQNPNEFYVTSGSGYTYTITAQSTNNCYSNTGVINACFAVEPSKIENTSPPSASVYKDSYLDPGLSTSKICSPSTSYHTTSHSQYAVISFNFGSGTSFSNQYSPGDGWNSSLELGDSIYDANANGIVWQLYTLTWQGPYYAGRNIQIYLASTIVYNLGGGCQAYNDQIYLPLSS